MNIQIINGPNLNLLGLREPGIYGAESFENFLSTLRGRFPMHALAYVQSNVEGEIINALHGTLQAGVAGVVLNAGAYTHTSIAIADAIAAIGIPVIEVHISNVMAREDYRHVSYIAPKCIGTITGLGLEGYALAIEYLIRKSEPEAAQKIGN